jgi:hypothetical protein
MVLRAKIRFLLSLLFLTLGITGKGQEMLGSVFGDYSGINAAATNPALLTGSKTYLDINILTTGVFFKNNWAYVPKEDKNIWDFINSDTLIPVYGKYRYNGVYTYYKNTNKKQFHQSVRIMGPSAMLQTGNHAFGISVSSRLVSSATNIPWEIPVFIYEGLTYDYLQNINFNDYNFNFSTLGWTEINASWAYDFKRVYKGKLTFGISGKLLLGHSGAYSVNNNADYVVYDPRNIEFFNYDSEYGFALPLDYNTHDPIYTGPYVKGYGLGADLGLVFTRLKKSFPVSGSRKLCGKPYEEYLYRIGISLLDLGGISFNKNAQKHVFDNVSVFWQEFDTVEYHSLNVGMQQLSQAFYGDPYESKKSDKISIGLPAAISLQFEGNFYKNAYFSVLWIQSLKFSQKQVLRPNQLALVPRYENNFFAFSLPLSILNYKYVRLGAAIRFGSLTIGTERLGILLGLTDLDGMDIYLSFKLSLTKGNCSTRKFGACYNKGF